MVQPVWHRQDTADCSSVISKEYTTECNEEADHDCWPRLAWRARWRSKSDRHGGGGSSHPVVKTELIGVNRSSKLPRGTTSKSSGDGKRGGERQSATYHDGGRSLPLYAKSIQYQPNGHRLPIVVRYNAAPCLQTRKWSPHGAVQPSLELDGALGRCVKHWMVKASKSSQGYHAGPNSKAAREQSQSYVGAPCLVTPASGWQRPTVGTDDACGPRGRCWVLLRWKLCRIVCLDPFLLTKRSSLTPHAIFLHERGSPRSFDDHHRVAGDQLRYFPGWYRPRHTT